MRNFLASALWVLLAYLPRLMPLRSMSGMKDVTKDRITVPSAMVVFAIRLFFWCSRRGKYLWKIVT